MNGSLGYSQEALRRLQEGTYRGRQQQYRTSEDQVKAIPKPVPALEGLTRSPSFDQTGNVDTANARARYEQRIEHKPIGRVDTNPQPQNDENYVVKRERYNQLMRDSRLANDIKTLAEVNYNNANRDATVSQEWADEYGAKNITGGMNKRDFINALSRRYNLTPEELNDMALTFHSDAYNAENEAYGKQLEKLGQDHSVLGSAGSFVGTLGSGIEGIYNNLVGGITGDDRYLSNIFRTTKNSPREGVKQNIESDFGKGVYDVGMGIGDMAVGAAAGSAPVVLAGNTANEAQASAMNRGSSVRKSSLYGTGAGALDFITNKIGLEKAKSLAVDSLKSTGLKNFLAKNAIAGTMEAGENIIQDLGQTLIDNIINGNNSELRTSYENKVANGLSGSDAIKEVAKEYAAQLGTSAALGFGMGSAMQAGTSILPKVSKIPQLVADTAGKIKNAQIDDFVRKNADVQNILDGKVPEVTKPIADNAPIVETVGDTSYVQPNDYRDVNGKIFVGRGTKILAKYTGNERLPIQSVQNGNRYEIPIDIYNKAVDNYNTAKSQGESGVATRLKKLYEGLFKDGTSYDSEVENLTVDGNPYIVTVNKGSVSKALGNKVEPNKLSVIEDLNNVIRSSNYVGSGDYVKGKSPNTSRYDYFEKPVSINGKDYLVTFSVAVEPKTNRYRTLGVIDEMKIQRLNSDTGASPNGALRPAENATELSGENSLDSNVNPETENVNIPDDRLTVDEMKQLGLDDDAIRAQINALVESNNRRAGLPEDFSMEDAQRAQIEALQEAARNRAENEGDIIEDVAPEVNTRNYTDAEIAEINDYVAARDAIRAEMNKSVNMFDLNAMTKLNELRAQGKAMDAEMASKYPELFLENGKFTGVPEQGEITEPDVKTQATPEPQTPNLSDISEDLGKITSSDVNFENISPEEGGYNPETGEFELYETGHSLGGEDEEPLVFLSTESAELPNLGFVEDGKSRVITNSAMNARVISRIDYDNDPVLQEIATYAKHNNEETYFNAFNNVKENGAKLLEEYNSGSRKLDNDQDVDQAMLLLKGLTDKMHEGAEDLKPQRDLLLSKLRQAGTTWGQNIQAFAKWNDTPDGALINGERLNQERVKPWKETNKQKVQGNNRIAKALADMGNKWKQVPEERPEISHEELKQRVWNEIEKEFGSVEQLFSDADIEYLTILAENRDIPIWQITSEIEHN